MHRCDDLDMRAAATQIGRQGLTYLHVGGMRVATQQSHRHHQHAIQTIAALRGLGINESLLHRMGLLRIAQTLQCGDVSVLHFQRRYNASTSGATVDQHGASTALAQAATEFGAVEPQVIAQHMQQSG